ncbi:myricetin O-methyltransferase-like [Asparagus officinalis]|uniref:myricetin O-methyltransferase-like n=1 Tax=Asparagus officinalis TaxID=4686 RepID=UPI00098E0190|nr:myricetin O-methyltransferase-like [Asparagus officinalis]
MAPTFVTSFTQLFGKVKSVVDAAAGLAMISRAVAQTFPEVKVTILDLPHVTEVMDKSEGRIHQYVAGDMFEYIPPADALVLKNCHSLKNCHGLNIHLWDEEEPPTYIVFHILALGSCPEQAFTGYAPAQYYMFYVSVAKYFMKKSGTLSQRG